MYLIQCQTGRYGYLIAELNSGRYFKKDLAPLKVITVGANKES